MEDRHLLYRVEEGVGHITINREPQRNAITPKLSLCSMNILMRRKRTKRSGLS